MKDKTYTVKVECMEGDKRATKTNPAFMELNITDNNGEIITRCVIKYDGKNWVKTHDDGKLHKKDFTEYMSQECANEVFNKVWSMGEEKPLEFVAHNLEPVEATFYTDDECEVVEEWENADYTLIMLNGVEEHTDEVAVEIINKYVKKFVKEHNDADLQHKLPLREEENEEGLYSYSYTIWKKSREN